MSLKEIFQHHILILLKHVFCGFMIDKIHHLTNIHNFWSRDTTFFVIILTPVRFKSYQK